MPKTEKTKLKVLCDYLINTDMLKERVKEGENGCLEWTAAKHNQGYGMISAKDLTQPEAKRKMMTAHRVAMMMKLNRRLNSDEMVIHTCMNMACVNPDHLVLGDTDERTKHMRKHGRTTIRHTKKVKK